MIGCDSRPGCPLDRTVRGDRRPRDPFRPAPPWPAKTTVRRRAGVPGGGAGPAGRTVGASLAADVPRPAGPPVPLPAQTARLPQTAQSRGTAAGHCDGSPGPPVAGLVRLGAADRRHPGPLRRLPGDRPAVRAGRVGALRLLRRAFALSPSGCWPWLPASGTTGQPANPSSGRSSRSTTEPIRNHSSRPACPASSAATAVTISA